MASEKESLDNHSSSMSEDSLNISFDDITYTVRRGIFKRERKDILRNLSGQFNAGELTVIMGQSGAGKSSLMDILSGYTKPTSGHIYVNGKVRNEKKFRRRSCYILQDDKVQDQLTIEESLRIAAKLKLGNHVSGDQKRERVREIIKALGLRHVQHTRAGRLSGGQKKRLAIGLELVNDPPVMFLDEPTSGLDCSMAKQIVYLLHLLARQGRTVIVSIHQPSATLLQMVDRLYAVVGGKCAFMGSVPLLLPYLDRMHLTCPPYHNPVDYLIEICTDNVTQLVESSQNGKSMQWIANITNEKLPDSRDTQNFSHFDDVNLTSLPAPNEDPTNKILLALKSTYSTSRWNQFTTLTTRSFLSSIRDPSFIYTFTGIHLLMGLLIGTLFFNIGEEAHFMRDNYNYLFFSLMFLMFTAFSAISITFPEQIPVVRREHFNRWYTTGAYYASTLVSTIPIQTVCTLTYTIVTFWMTGQPFEIVRFSMFTSTLLLVSYVSLVLGLFNGSLFNVQNGVIFGPFFILPFTVFSGFFLRYSDAPSIFRWLFHISFLKHGLVGLMISIYDMGRPKLACNADYCHYKLPSFFLKENEMHLETFTIACVALVATGVVVIAGSYVILRIRLKHKW